MITRLFLPLTIGFLLVISTARAAPFPIPSSIRTPLPETYKSQAKKALSSASFSIGNGPMTKTASKREWGVGFYYPENWDYHDEVSHMYVTPLEGPHISTMRGAYVVVMMRKLRVPISLTRAHNDFMQEASMGPTDSTGGDYFIPSFTMLSSGSTMMVGRPANSYVFTGERGSKIFKAHAVITAFDNVWLQAYVITPPEYFEMDDAVFEKLLSTLAISAKSSSSSARPSAAQKHLKTKSATKRFTSSKHSSSSSARFQRR